MIGGIILFFIFLISIELYCYKGFKKVLPNNSTAWKIWWFIDILIVVFCLLDGIWIKHSGLMDFEQYRHFFKIAGLVVTVYIPKLTFVFIVLIDDLGYIIRYISKRQSSREAIINRNYVSRIKRQPLFLTVGIIFSALTIFFPLYGILFGKTNYTLEKVTLTLPSLPKTFDGLRIVQISDMHLGSFGSASQIHDGIDLINEQNPDIIVFTGDLVNNEAAEAKPMIAELKRLYAPLGKFAVLGNHDMGDYRRWYTIDEKIENLQNLKNIYKEIGFKLLLDEHVSIKKGNDSIAIAGVQNWGNPPFKRYGNLKKAMENTKSFPFKILLSHDPSHWDADVLPNSTVDLTLSGHTHAMQVGINFFGNYWSPVSWRYKRWWGLYEQWNRYLYVNRGFGFIGFPGRMGASPEITLITLYH